MPNLRRSTGKALLPGKRQLAFGVALGTKDSRQCGNCQGKEEGKEEGRWGLNLFVLGLSV